MSHALARMAAAIIVLIVASGPAAAVSISYNLLNINDNRWEYQYAIGNTPLAAPVREFSIYFDLGPGFSVLHSDLAIKDIPAGWDGLLLPPDPRLPHGGLFDALALDDGIGANLLLEGFAVEFTWLGIGAPGAQRFEIIDPDTFDIIESGLTFERDPALPDPVTVPEPATSLLFATAVAGLLLVRLRSKRNVRGKPQ